MNEMMNQKATAAALPRAATMYKAMVQRDASYEGIFVAGVKTTGIFCRPTCTARKPMRPNVEFFGTPKEAILRGYRPCKVCRPLAIRGETPAWLRPLLAEIDSTPGLRLKDSDLKMRGLDPNRVRRWFKQHHGMTFQGYLRSLRIGEAFGRIRNGDRVIDTAFDSGYESLSGFTESFKKIARFPPRQSARRTLVTVTRILTPLGPMLAGATEEGICLLDFVDRRALETELKQLNSKLDARCIPGKSKHFKALEVQLKEYFAGTRTTFDLPLVLIGTPFQKAAWKGLLTIPYGSTRSYEEQARRLGRPKAVRAVARANGANRIGIIIPCHRVIGKNGKLVGYGGGLWRKQRLLDHEALHKPGKKGQQIRRSACRDA